jgi:hypothetical protein
MGKTISRRSHIKVEGTFLTVGAFYKVAPQFRVSSEEEEFSPRLETRSAECANTRNSVKNVASHSSQMRRNQHLSETERKEGGHEQYGIEGIKPDAGDGSPRRQLAGAVLVLQTNLGM